MGQLTQRGRWELLLPAGPNYPGFLTWREEQQARLTVALSASKARILEVLRSIMDADFHRPEPARGWARAEKLADLIAEKTDYPLAPETVTAYVSRLRQAICAEVKRSRLSTVIPPIIEQKRGLGVRLATDDLKVIVPDDRGTEP